MYKYQIIMDWSEEDNCYVTTVPELPGCMSDGKTPEEAMRNTQEVISVWLECAKADNEEAVDQAIYESEQEVANGAEPVNAEIVFEKLEKKYFK